MSKYSTKHLHKVLLLLLIYMNEYSGLKIPLYNYGNSLITFIVMPIVSDVKSYLEYKLYYEEYENEEIEDELLVM